MGSGGR